MNKILAFVLDVRFIGNEDNTISAEFVNEEEAQAAFERACAALKAFVVWEKKSIFICDPLNVSGSFAVDMNKVICVGLRNKI